MTPQKTPKAPISDQEAAKRMRALSGDTELIHGEADELLEEILLSLGYKATVAAYRKVPKWYA